MLVLLRLRKYFAELTQEDLELFWQEFVHQRGKPYKGFPFDNGLELFDYLAEQGFYHCELVSGLTRHRELMGKIYGQEL